MVKKSKGKHRLDKFYRLAKEQGYRSRAAFKLLQLNRQFRFLERTRTCLDLCAAPGGWMQVAVSQMPLNSLVIGIDLDPIKPVRGARSIVGDITTARARAAIKKEAAGAMMEVVLHDGAPNVGGVWASEAYSQSTLVLDALKLATEFLLPNGTFVTKIFRSQDYTALLYAFKLLFNKVEATKPAASRDTSAEIFVVCLGYKAPAKIDPCLLDPKHLFKEVTEEVKSMGPDALLKQKMKQKRFREGYEEGLSSMHKEASALAFLTSDGPVEMLGQFTKFSLGKHGDEDGGGGVVSAKKVLEHRATTAEIMALMSDLQVLGRSEFKALLRWRLKLRKDLGLGAAKAKPAAAESEDGDQQEEQDPEQKLLEEMQGVKDNMTRRQKREKKKKVEAKRKFRLRAAQLDKSEGIADATGPDPLFSLTAITGKSAEDIGDDTEAPDEDAAEDSQPEEGNGLDSEEEDLDSDEERRRYEDDQEEAMEEAYQEYLFRQGQRQKAAELKSTKEAKPGDLFKQPNVEKVVQEPQEESVEPPKKKVKALAGLTEAAEQSSDEEADLLLPVNDQMEEYKSLDDEEIMVPRGPKALGTADKLSKGQAEKEGSEYQEVPLSESDADSGGSADTDVEEPDEHTAAEIRAYAKAMLNGRTKSDVLEAGYHRYAFHDDNVPIWLADDEKRHMRPPPVVTKGDVEAEKQRLKSLEAQPIKKIAEAKARKKKRLQVRLEQAKTKANSIVEQGDLSERAKAKEVAALYAKAKKSGKAPKKKASRSDKFKKKGPPLDRRLMSDKRPVNNKSKKKAAKSRKKGQGGKSKGKGR